ncbi:MAG: hypothetical protein ACRDYB_01425, partial [Acidimicrobiales bacterium]
QGIVALALHGLTGGANLRFLMVASLVALVAVLVAFGAWYHRLKRIWLLLLPVTFFFAPRSFTGYLIDLFPVALVGLLTVETVPAAASALRWGRIKVARLAVVGLGLATATVTALSLTAAPLELKYVSSNIGPMQQHLFAVTVGVTNTTDGSVTPNFLVDLGAAHPSGFWHAAHDSPVVIAPHQTVDVTLFPPPDTPAYLPPFASDYVVDAYLPNPRSLSTTNDIWHNYIPKLNQHP